MDTRSTKRTVLALVAAVGMAASAALVAESHDELSVPELQVEYGDLDLTKAEGVKALHRRLTAAAGRVCPRTDGRVGLEQRLAGRECRKQSLERAVRAIGSPELAALHATTVPRG
jgi:UrcA family protein